MRASQYFGVEGGAHAADMLPQLGVSAIIASSDDMVLGAIRAIQRKGLRAPSDISVPIERIAENTTRAILAVIANRELPPGEVLTEPKSDLEGRRGRRQNRATGLVCAVPGPSPVS